MWAVHAWTGSQVNVHAGSLSTGSLLGARGNMFGGFVNRWSLSANSHLEMSGGDASVVVTAGLSTGPIPDASKFVMTGGEVGFLDATGDVLIRGGMVQTFVFRGGGSVDVVGGSIGDDFQVGSAVTGVLPDDPNREVVVGRSGTVSVRGGSIGRGMTIRDGRTLDYSGGTIGDGFQALDGSRLIIRGTNFLLDGVSLNSPVGEELALTQRNMALEGLLADGRMFRFDLNSEPGGGDYFSPAATISVLVIPEPRTNLLVVVLSIVLVATKGIWWQPPRRKGGASPLPACFGLKHRRRKP